MEADRAAVRGAGASVDRPGAGGDEAHEGGGVLAGHGDGGGHDVRSGDGGDQACRLLDRAVNFIFLRCVRGLRVAWRPVPAFLPPFCICQ